jgi:hypothetical protein
MSTTAGIPYLRQHPVSSHLLPWANNGASWLLIIRHILINSRTSGRQVRDVSGFRVYSKIHRAQMSTDYYPGQYWAFKQVPVYEYWIFCCTFMKLISREVKLSCGRPTDLDCGLSSSSSGGELSGGPRESSWVLGMHQLLSNEHSIWYTRSCPALMTFVLLSHQVPISRRYGNHKECQNCSRRSFFMIETQLLRR